MTKSLPVVNLGNALAGNMLRVAAEERKAEIRRKIHASKHYVAYPETIQGKKDLDTDMRRRTRVGGVGELWRNFAASMIPLLGGRETHFSRKWIREAKTDFERKKIGVRKGSYLKQESGFRDKICQPAVVSAERRGGNVYR